VTPEASGDSRRYVQPSGIVSTVRSHPVFTAAFVAAMVLAPLVLDRTGNVYWVTLLTELFVFAIVVLSFDLLFGYTGLLSFGHALFFGMGSYVVAILSRDTPLTYLGAVPVTLVIVLVASLFIGFVALRLRGVYFAILMLAFGQLGFQLVVQFSDLTGGRDGISGLDIPSIFGFDLTAQYPSYFVTLAVLTLVYVALYRIVDSPFGHVLQGIHQNETRMAMLGIDVFRHKLGAFTIAGVIAGLAGVLYPLYLNFVDPSLVNWTTTGDVLVMTLIGGMGTLWGPVVGTGFFIFAQGLLETFTEQWRIVLGAVFIVVVLVFPAGLAGLVSGDADTGIGPANGLDRLRDALETGREGDDG